LGVVCAESEVFCYGLCAWCLFLWCGFVVYVVCECVGFAVVGAFEFGDLEVFWFASAGHRVSPRFGIM